MKMDEKTVQIEVKLSSAAVAAIGALLEGTTELGNTPSKKELKEFLSAALQAMAIAQLPALTYRDVNPYRDPGGKKRLKKLLSTVQQLQDRQGLSRAQALGHAAAIRQLEGLGNL
jgi:hypothetical protein